MKVIKKLQGSAGTLLGTLMGAIWLAVFPLWQDGSYAHITRTKWQGMLILCGATVLLGLICCGKVLYERDAQAWSSKPLAVNRKRLRFGWPQGLAALYFGWLGLSALFGSMAGGLNERDQLTVWMGAIRYEGMATQLCYFAIFLMLSLCPVNLRAVMNAAAIAMLLFGVCVGLQYADINVLGMYPAGRSIRTNYEFQGTIGNIDMVSGYLSLLTPLLLGGYVTDEQSKRGLLLTGGMVGVMLLVLIDVEAGLLALLVAACLLAVLLMIKPEYRARGCVVLGGCALCFALGSMLHLPWLDGTETVVLTAPGGMALLLMIVSAGMLVLSVIFRKHAGRGLSNRSTVLMIALALIVAIAAVYCAPVDESAGTLWEVSEILHGRAQDSFGKERIGVWRMTLDMSKDNLLFGTGQDTFYYAFGDYVEEHGNPLSQKFDYPHNEYVAILSNAGIPALLAYLALTGMTMIFCIRRSNRQPMLLALMAAVAGYMVQAHFSFSICLVAPMFWAVLGIACRGVCLGKMVDAKKHK